MTTGLRVLFVASEPGETATYRYRNQHLADALNRAGHQAEVVYVGRDRVRVAADVVVLHRISAVPEGLAFARAARACGAVLVYSTDDLVFNEEAFPSQGEPWERIRAFAPLHAAMLREADAVLVSTDFLGREAARLFGPNKPVFTIRNFLSDELLQLSERAASAESRRKAQEGTDRPLTFGYLSGTATHDADLALITAPLAEQLYTRNARLFVVGPITLAGAFARLRDEHGRVRQIPFLPWRELPGLIAQLDVNLAPLDLNHSFVRAKSEIKFLEAAAAGVPTIATRAEGFAEAVPDSACLFCDDAWEWAKRLQEVFENAEERRRLADNAYAHLLTHATVEAQTTPVAETFVRIAALSPRTRGDRAEADRSTWVNYPFAPPKYWVKALLRKVGK